MGLPMQKCGLHQSSSDWLGNHAFGILSMGGGTLNGFTQISSSLPNWAGGALWAQTQLGCDFSFQRNFKGTHGTQAR